MSDRTRTRRKRRQDKAALRNPAAKPAHNLKGGRTGKVHSARLKSRRGK